MTKEGQTRRILRDQTLKEPATIELYPSELYTFQKPYPLDEAEYLTLTKSRTRLETAAYALFGGTAIFGIRITAKIIGSFFSKEPSNVETWELIAVVIAFTVSSLLVGLNAILRNERRKLSKKIHKHFKENEKFLGIRK